MLSSVPEHSGHRCSICEKTFSTSSHLRRHEALHNGRVTATCPSCDKRFSRLDTARRHVAACSRSQTEPIVLEPGRRGGRERKACVTCSQRKLACDGGSPCARCVSSPVPRSYQHRQSSESTPHIDTSSHESEVVDAAITAAPKSPSNVPGKVPISFLLAFTAPAEHRATATLLVADDGQHVESMPDDEFLDVPPASSFSLDYFDALFWDQQSWATEFLDFTSCAPEDANAVSYPAAQIRAHSHDGTTSHEAVEVLQAALIMEIIQNRTNNVQTRRRLRIQRHPRLVAALRNHEIFEAVGEHPLQINRSVQPAWQEFIREETRIRLASWAFIMDSCFAIMFNSCPLITISELQVDFPCREDVFEAESEAAFNDLVSCRNLRSRHAPAQIFKDILLDDWTPEAYINVDATGLGIVICALQSQTMTARHWSLLPTTQTIILRAADRWEQLWHSLTDRDGSEEPPLKGFTKNNEELCSFVRMLVRAGNIEVPGCRYTRIQPTDDIGHLNQFLKRFGAV
ncbi:unnamed protein product [Zymoseptoria tritici ST99CH_1A5]|uniref:C2H2-type domain-containing protein n=1 Tax=Zymoseptoria tritici ST99CH_1A5 TaxID=1276529 RepID=A0A1Y6LW48_ZYMTR|nr:unnamed protein product [Zymoseptoria tritici ST99CH_1A5]